MFKPSSLSKNFTEGALFTKIILFALPIMFTGVLQNLYNIADHIIVGQFSGDPLALAAVGSTASLTSIVVNLLVGISAGTGVVVAQSYGAKNYDMVSKISHTSLAFAAIGGIGFCLFGCLISRPTLILMGTKPELLDAANLYMCIICAGIPASAVMNFGAASIRSSGDSKTPMIIFTLSGLVNVIFNLLFVISFGMSVDGVALATIISQYMSAVAIVVIMYKRRSEAYALQFKELKIRRRELSMVLRYGVPAALQGAMYGISNIFISSAANVFTTVEISARTIAGNVDGILYSSINSYQHAAMTVTAQNYGAGKYNRINKTLVYTLLQAVVIAIGLGQILLVLADPIMSMFVAPADPNRTAVLATGMDLLVLMLNTYFIIGFMEVLSGIMRGLGYSVLPTVISVCGICGIRTLWVSTIFKIPAMRTLVGLYTVYPVSWFVTSLAFAVACIFAWKKLGRIRKSSEKSLELQEIKQSV